MGSTQEVGGEVGANDGPSLTPAWIAEAGGGRWHLPPTPEDASRRLHGVGIDSREDLSDRAFLAIRGERHDGHRFVGAAVEAGAAMVIVDASAVAAGAVPSLRVPILVVDDGRRALTRLARAWRAAFPGRVIAVTGSCGKTTTKRLIHAALSTRLRGSASPKSFNNDLGVPLTLLAAAGSDDYVVVEVGTNRPGEIAMLADLVRPHVGVITMVGHAHLEELGSLEGVAAEKSSLLDRLASPAIAVIRADGGLLESAVESRRGRLGGVIRFGDRPKADVRMTDRRVEGEGQVLSLADGRRLRLRLDGTHNALNALAAVAVADRLGIPFEPVARALEAVEPTDRRLEVRVVAALRVLDDAYNANPDSMSAALETLVERVGRGPAALVLGDMLELGPLGPEAHRRLGRLVGALGRSIDLRRVVLVGPLSAHAARECAAILACPVEHHPAATPEIAATLQRELPAGTTVLLKASRGIGLDRIGAWLASPDQMPTSASSAEVVALASRD